MRACRAVAESAVWRALLTALAPGIRDCANTLSFSRWVSSCFLSGSLLVQPSAVAASSASGRRRILVIEITSAQVGVLTELIEYAAVMKKATATMTFAGSSIVSPRVGYETIRVAVKIVTARPPEPLQESARHS